MSVLERKQTRLDLSRGHPAPALEEIDTPALLIDLDAVERNLTRWQAFCDARGLANRPHIKTHKLVPLARWQLAHGARGITCQKLGEAEIMADAGIDDILVTYNVIGRAKLERMAALARRVHLTLVADSEPVVQGLSEAASTAGVEVGVRVECDTGGGRCGVVSPEDAARLAGEIDRRSGLRFAGLLTYPAPGTRTETAAFLAKARAECERMGLAVETISTGGSPDLWSREGLDDVDEYRAGTYIYNDRALVARGVAAPEDCALTVLATVVSRPVPERAIIDAGSKALTSDLSSQPGYGSIVGCPDAAIVKLNEEHGTLDMTRSPDALRVADRVRVVPNHACVVTNLFDQVYLMRGDRVVCAHPVDARGRVT